MVTLAEKIEALQKGVLTPWSYGMASQTAMRTGAKILAYWDKASRLCQVAIAVNPPQTRKSDITSVISDIGRALDRLSQPFRRLRRLRNFCTLSVDESDRFLRYLGLSEQTIIAPFLPSRCLVLMEEIWLTS